MGRVVETQPLFTGAEWKCGDSVLGEVKKNRFYFIALPGKGGHGGLMPVRLCPALEGVARSLIVMVQRGGRE